VLVKINPHTNPDETLAHVEHDLAAEGQGTWGALLQPALRPALWSASASRSPAGEPVSTPSSTTRPQIFKAPASHPTWSRSPHHRIA